MGRYHAPSTLDSSLSARPAKRVRTHPAAPTIRFEMPFPIWCSTCPSTSPSALIGQGVRFNAHKTKVGNYHSTPVWCFLLKHNACGGRIEIRTDPQHHDFVVTEGATKRDFGDDAAVAARTGGVILETGGLGAAVKKVEGEDPFAAFEGKRGQETEIKDESRRLEELRSQRERDWKDPGDVNRRLRKAFRDGRRWRDGQRERGESLADSYGLAFDIGEEVLGDEVKVRGIDFGAADEEDVMARGLFEEKATDTTEKGRRTRLEMLQRNVVGNTRVTTDAFGSKLGVQKLKPAVPGLKRRDKDEAIEDRPTSELRGVEADSHPATDGDVVDKSTMAALLDYSSDDG